MYITVRQQELRMCKGNRLCKSTIYFDLDPESIKENCKFNFYYNKTDWNGALALVVCSKAARNLDDPSGVSEETV